MLLLGSAATGAAFKAQPLRRFGRRIWLGHSCLRGRSVEEQDGEESPYERLLGDAMIGDGALFTREDAVEAAWAVVDPVLKTHYRTRSYKRHSWGPREADSIIVKDGSWHNPRP